MWSKPNYIELDRKTVMERINAKAWSVGDAIECGKLCEKGLGASGVILLPDGTYGVALVSAYDFILGLYELIVNGDTFYFDPILRKLF